MIRSVHVTCLLCTVSLEEWRALPIQLHHLIIGGIVLRQALQSLLREEELWRIVRASAIGGLVCREGHGREEVSPMHGHDILACLGVAREQVWRLLLTTVGEEGHR